MRFSEGDKKSRRVDWPPKILAAAGVVTNSMGERWLGANDWGLTLEQVLNNFHQSEKLFFVVAAKNCLSTAKMLAVANGGHLMWL